MFGPETEYRKLDSGKGIVKENNAFLKDPEIWSIRKGALNLKFMCSVFLTGLAVKNKMNQLKDQ